MIESNPRPRLRLIHPVSPLDCGVEILPESVHACMKSGEKWGVDRTRNLYDPKYDIAALQPKKELGRGTFGSVYSADTPDGEVAVKFIDFSKDEGDFPATAVREMEARVLDHPNVMGICRVGIKTVGGKTSFAMVMDRAAQSALDYIQGTSAGPMTQELLNVVLFQMVIGVAYAHYNLVIHRDIKPGNFLVSGEKVGSLGILPRIMLADFGLCMDNVTEPIYLRMDTSYSTPFRAPELVFPENFRLLSYAADVWALACVFYEIATGVRLFAGENNDGLQKEIISLIGMPSEEERKKNVLFATRPAPVTAPGPRTFTQKMNPIMAKYGGSGTLLVLLLQRMLSWQPGDRPTIFKVISDPYFKYSMQMNVKNFFTTPGAGDAREYPPVGLDAEMRANPNSALARFEDRMSRIWRDVSSDSASTFGYMARLVGDLILKLSKRIPTYPDTMFAALFIMAWCLAGPKYPVVRSIDASAQMSCLAIACHFIAFKARAEMLPAPPQEYVDILPASGSVQNVLAIELETLKAFDFDFTFPTALDFARQYAMLNKVSRTTSGIVLLSLLLNEGTALLDPAFLAKLAVFVVKRGFGEFDFHMEAAKVGSTMSSLQLYFPAGVDAMTKFAASGDYTQKLRLIFGSKTEEALKQVTTLIEKLR
jgi:serine/threonine protein kinase